MYCSTVINGAVITFGILGGMTAVEVSIMSGEGVIHSFSTGF